jgi:hypothetical protein
MHTSATYGIMFLAAWPLFGAQPPAPPVSPPPAEPKAAGPALDDAVLPPPRPTPASMPASSIVEEPAPAPHELPGGSVPLLPPRPFHEEPAPMPHAQTLPPARFSMPQASQDPSLSDVAALRREIEQLRMVREAMLAEEMDLMKTKDLRAAQSNGVGLRMRVAELLAKVAQQSRRGEGGGERGEGKNKPQPSTPNVPPSTLHTSAPPQTPQPNEGNAESGSKKTEGKDHVPPSTLRPPPSTPSTVTDAPVDPLALAQSLFRAGDYTAALNVYRKLDKEDQKPEDRIAILYMMACCLRKLGKMDEASVLYREAANSPGNDFLMENAQWYLRTLKDRRELEAQLEELRQRRQAVKPRKP